jgi:hypothetical protein
MCDPAGKTVIKTWIVISVPGLVPEKKMPPQSHDGVLGFLRELIACRPAEADLIVCELTWDHDLWVSCGREMVHIADTLNKTPRRKRTATQ